MSNKKFTQKQSDSIAELASKVKSLPPQKDNTERDNFIIKLKKEGFSDLDVTLMVITEFGERISPQAISKKYIKYRKEHQ